MALIVQKYGGSSVKDTDRIKNVANRVAEYRRQGDQVVVVVSAMDVTPAQRAQMNGGVVDIIPKSITTAKDVSKYLRDRLHLNPHPSPLN